MTPEERFCGRCGTPLMLAESKRDGYCDDHRGNNPAPGDPDYVEDEEDRHPSGLPLRRAR